MWKRGNCSRSSRRTFRPRLASAVAALDPPGPPPTTATSKFQPAVTGVMPPTGPPLARARVGRRAAALPDVLAGDGFDEVGAPAGPGGDHELAALDRRGMAHQLVLPRHVVDVDLH